MTKTESFPSNTRDHASLGMIVIVTILVRHAREVIKEGITGTLEGLLKTPLIRVTFLSVRFRTIGLQPPITIN